MFEKKVYYSTANELVAIGSWLDGNSHNLNGPSTISFHKNGHVSGKMYYKDGKLNNNHLPAWVGYFYNGKLRFKTFYLNGLKNNYDNIASYTSFYIAGTVKCETYFTLGKYSNDRPSRIFYHKNGNKKLEEYFNFQYGLHNKNGPAKLYYNKDGCLIKCSYYLNNKFCRTKKVWEKNVKLFNIS